MHRSVSKQAEKNMFGLGFNAVLRNYDYKIIHKDKSAAFNWST